MKKIKSRMIEKDIIPTSNSIPNVEQSTTYLLNAKLLRITLNYPFGSDYLTLLECSIALINQHKAKLLFSTKRKMSFKNTYHNYDLIIEKVYNEN